MYIYNEDPESFAVSAGLFESELINGPSKHIFAKDKCSWYKISNDLPQIQKY
jgi:hypothetical protein